jgi:glucosamine--fructose-6-phosphate aminotransferase (isomerizing)
MCGIVAAAARREVSEILLEGLRRLEYRGYDSAGMALIDNEQRLQLHKYQGKVAALEEAQALNPILGCTGIAHTRWATHGQPSAANAHPHISGQRLASCTTASSRTTPAARRTARRGLRIRLRHGYGSNRSLTAQVNGIGATLLRPCATRWRGWRAPTPWRRSTWRQPDEVVAARSGSPLVVGVGIGEHFLASDTLALRQVTDRFIYLEEGDVVACSAAGLAIYDAPASRCSAR